MEMKKCNGCQIVKPLSEFHNRTASSDGKDSQCKECRCHRNKDDGTKLDYVRQNPINYKRIGIHAEEILTSIGYDLYDPDNSVYSQFKKRMEEKGRDTSGWD